MCIAILNPANLIKDESIKNSWDNNDQGAGLLWYDQKSKTLGSYKSYKYKKFLNKYKELRACKDIGCIVLHFRIATSGFEKYTNLHPFFVNNDLGFVHNGIIPGLGNNKYSDTYEFNEKLKSLDSNFYKNKSLMDILSMAINGSKLVFLDSTNTYTIVNEEAGIWEDGNWYSNNSYKMKNDFVWYGNTKVSNKKDSYSYAYDGYYNTYDNNNLISEDSQINMDYIQTYFRSTDKQTVDTLLWEINKDISDHDVIDSINELADFYNTVDLKVIIKNISSKYSYTI